MGRAWILDTSSAVEVKQLPNVVKRQVWEALEALVDANKLFFPRQVVDELNRYYKAGDPPAVWAARNASAAAPLVDLLPRVAAVVHRLPDLIDATKLSTPGVDDDADPYVIAHGLERRDNGYDVTIITDDYRPQPRKTSLSDAAGVFLLPSVTLRVFLVTEGIWDGTTGT